MPLGKKQQSKEYKASPNDVIYTPKLVAMKMIEMSNITPNMKVLDPSKGGGVFYDNLPECKKDWCEIVEGKDFFQYNEKVDLILGNPPYSIWDKWIEHTIKITDKFCYIMGVFNFTDMRVRNIINAGFGLTALHLLKIDWWFSPSYLVIFERGKQSIISVEEKRIVCAKCNKRCGLENKHLFESNS
jgi:hypothetical protein